MGIQISSKQHILYNSLGSELSLLIRLSHISNIQQVFIILLLFFKEEKYYSHLFLLKTIELTNDQCLVMTFRMACGILSENTQIFHLKKFFRIFVHAHCGLFQVQRVLWGLFLMETQPFNLQQRPLIKIVSIITNP